MRGEFTKDKTNKTTKPKLGSTDEEKPTIDHKIYQEDPFYTQNCYSYQNF
ncbi:hypothetical protein pb186bvf_014308 [Paramecium bursaria]